MHTSLKHKKKHTEGGIIQINPLCFIKRLRSHLWNQPLHFTSKWITQVWDQQCHGAITVGTCERVDSLFKRYLKLWMNCLNASVLFDRGTMMLMRMLRVFRLSLFTFTTGPNGLKSTSWEKSREPSPLNISSYTVPLSRSVRVNPETEAERKQGNHNPRFICSYSLMHLV